MFVQAHELMEHLDVLFGMTHLNKLSFISLYDKGDFAPENFLPFP